MLKIIFLSEKMIGVFGSKKTIPAITASVKKPYLCNHKHTQQ